MLPFPVKIHEKRLKWMDSQFFKQYNSFLQATGFRGVRCIFMQ